MSVLFLTPANRKVTQEKIYLLYIVNGHFKNNTLSTYVQVKVVCYIHLFT